MIISASRRTDIPAFFSEWIINRLKEQYAYVRNPMNIHQVSKINLSPDVVDCIVFWSKNPKPIINKLNALKDYMYYFQFTLNAYDKDFEENLPTLSTRIDTFQTLSNYIGKMNVSYGVMIPLSLTKNTLLIGTLKDSNTLQNNSVFIQKK